MEVSSYPGALIKYSFLPHGTSLTLHPHIIALLIAHFHFPLEDTAYTFEMGDVNKVRQRQWYSEDMWDKIEWDEVQHKWITNYEEEGVEKGTRCTLALVHKTQGDTLREWSVLEESKGSMLSSVDRSRWRVLGARWMTKWGEGAEWGTHMLIIEFSVWRIDKYVPIT